MHIFSRTNTGLWIPLSSTKRIVLSEKQTYYSISFEHLYRLGKKYQNKCDDIPYITFMYNMFNAFISHRRNFYLHLISVRQTSSIR